MGVHQPEKTKPLAAVVDRALRECYAFYLEVDTLDPNGPSDSQENRAERSLLPVRSGGSGFRPTVERAQFLNTPRNVASQFLATQHTRGLWSSLDSVCGAVVFTAENAATRWTAF